MNAQEAKIQETRINRFRLLDTARSALYSTREKMHQKSCEPDALPSHDSPFTGNTRESRRVASMKIDFTATLGGESPRSIELNYLNIPAWELGRAIEGMIEDRIKQMNDEIEKL